MKVIVGFDATPSSGDAVMWAANEAHARDVPLRIVSWFATPNAQPAAVAEARLILVRIAATFPEMVISTEVSSASPARALITDAGSEDLIVVGSNGPAGDLAQLVRHSPCTIAVIRGAAGRRTPDRIVVGVDDVPDAEGALRWACLEANRHAVDLLVVHAWQSTQNTLDESRRVLQSAIRLAQRECTCTVTGALIEQSPADAMSAATRDGDLLVVGSHAQNSGSRCSATSNVSQILESRGTSVIIVPTPQRVCSSDRPANERLQALA